MRDWPADKIERRKVGDLVPYVRNARTHSPDQVAQVAASINEWGWTVPVLIDEDGEIIAGHCRILAARKLGIGEVPCMTATGWTKAQKQAYVLADNQLAQNAGWDQELLSVEMQDLNGQGFDLGLIGFGDDMLANLLADPTAGMTDEDDVPDAPDDPVTVDGDVWIMGKHRLICGDCTSADAVDKLLAGVEPHLMVTDPPYGVEYDADWRNKALRADGSPIGGRAIGKVENDDTADWSGAWALFPGDVAYIWHAGNKAHIVASSLNDTGFNIRAQIIWAKSNMVIGRGDYHPKHEPCWYAVRKGKKGHYRGGRKQTTVWNIDKPMKSETGHSTQKPVECMKRPIENNSSPGQAVYEPFSGSGTTIIACEETARCCYAMEISPSYVDMAIIRWQNFTGNDAIHEATGETYSKVKNSDRAEAA